MEKRFAFKNSHHCGRRKKVVAAKHLVASIPIVQVADRIGVHVPTVVVPVHVDGPEFVQRAVHATALRVLSGLYFICRLKARQHTAPILFFFEKLAR